MWPLSKHSLMAGEEQESAKGKLFPNLCNSTIYNKKSTDEHAGHLLPLPDLAHIELL